MDSVLVIGGAGYMGAGIVQVCAQSGYKVYLNDSNTSAVGKALDNIERSLNKLSGKKAIDESPSSVMSRIKTANDLSVASSVDWIIETVAEVEELKASIFSELDSLASADTPISTNTSTITIHQIADKTKYPGRIVGMHFFMPIQRSHIIEVVKGDNTTSEIFERACAFVESMGKRPIRVMRDIPGFVYNRVFGAAFKQAIDLVEQGIITPEEVDFGMRDAYGWELGPFEMADIGGIGTFANAFRSYKLLGEDALAPTGNLLDKMIKEGRLGKRVGKGFYEYPRTNNPD
ncbi:MAG: 3-hydroxyacyl-CoA dehydrogenase family protein [Dehalococcoidia bacterium]